MASEAEKTTTVERAEPDNPKQHAGDGWWWAVIVFPLMTGIMLRLLGASLIGCAGATVVCGLVVWFVGRNWAIAQARGERPVMQAARQGVRIKRWLLEEHDRAFRRWVLGVLFALVALAGAVWVLSPDARLGASIALALCLTVLCLYAGHKCCGPASTRRKLLVGAAAFISGVQGNYLASLTVGGGGDAKAIELAISPVVNRLDLISAQIRGVRAGVDRLEKHVEKANELSEAAKQGIDEITTRLLGMVEQKDRELGDLRAQLAAASERRVRAEIAEGRSESEAIENLRRSDPKDLIAFLDSEIERDESELIEKHRERAAVCYVTGEIDKAMQSLNVILAMQPDDLSALNEMGHIKILRGELDEAARLYTRVGELAPDDSVRAVSFGNLGLIEQTRGNLDAAEAYLKKALDLHEKLGSQKGMAANYGNLGLIERTRGNLDAAEAYLKKALDLNEKLGSQEGMAIQYGNLGLIEWTRGNLDAAEVYFKKSLEINEKLGRPEGMANQYGNLGLIERTRGNLDAAEAYHKKALAIDEKLGRPEGMADQYGNLGLIEWTRGNLDAAEVYFKKSLEINEKLGRPEGMAANYGNLGLIEQTRGNLDAAEAYHKKSLAIEEKLGRPEGMANQYGNLGLIERTRGNLDAAEAYHKKALAINEKLGRPEGMADQYGNLGLIERTRGNLDAAEVYFKKSLEINEKLGRPEGMAANYGNLGLIEQTRGNLDAAEAYLKKSLAINEKLGNQAGMAVQYGNLGVIELTRGNLDAAEAYLKKSLAIEEKLGRPEGMAANYGNLGRVEQTRGNMKEACRLWTLARDLFRKVGVKDRERLVQGWMDEAGCSGEE